MAQKPQMIRNTGSGRLTVDEPSSQSQEARRTSTGFQFASRDESNFKLEIQSRSMFTHALSSVHRKELTAQFAVWNRHFHPKRLHSPSCTDF